jgi:hypothetical protein
MTRATGSSHVHPTDVYKQLVPILDSFSWSLNFSRSHGLDFRYRMRSNPPESLRRWKSIFLLEDLSWPTTTVACLAEVVLVSLGNHIAAPPPDVLLLLCGG